MYNCTLVYKVTHFQNNIEPNRLLKNGGPKTTLFLKHSIEILKSLYPQDYTFYVLNILWLTAVTNGWDFVAETCHNIAVMLFYLCFDNSKLIISLSLFLEQSQAGQLVFLIMYSLYLFTC